MAACDGNVELIQNLLGLGNRVGRTQQQHRVGPTQRHHEQTPIVGAERRGSAFGRRRKQLVQQCRDLCRAHVQQRPHDELRLAHFGHRLDLADDFHGAGDVPRIALDDEQVGALNVDNVHRTQESRGDARQRALSRGVGGRNLRLRQQHVDGFANLGPLAFIGGDDLGRRDRAPRAHRVAVMTSRHARSWSGLPTRRTSPVCG